MSHRSSNGLSRASQSPPYDQPVASRSGHGEKLRSMLFGGKKSSVLTNLGARVMLVLGRPASGRKDSKDSTASRKSAGVCGGEYGFSSPPDSSASTILHDQSADSICLDGFDFSTSWDFWDVGVSRQAHGPTIGHLERTLNLEGNVQGRCLPALCKLLDNTAQPHRKSSAEDRTAHRRHSDHTVTTYPTPTAFIERLLNHSKNLCTPCVVVVGLIYLYRLKDQMPSMRLTPSNVTTLLTVAFVVASKYCEDFGCSNAEWAEVAGIPLQELNTLELDLLFALSFDLSVSKEECDLFVQDVLLPGPSADDEEEAPTLPPTQFLDPDCLRFSLLSGGAFARC